MQESYTLNVAGMTRQLPICPVNEHLSIAAFVMFGDVEITVACAKELLARCPDFDYLLTAEAKGIPLAYEMARQSGKPYLIARKGHKLYMQDPVEVADQSITTVGQQSLVVDRTELEALTSKRILLVDDVISTGGSMQALESLAAHSRGVVVGKAAVLAEGDAAKRSDIIFLEHLPVFVH